LGRLAVDRGFQRRGLGERLLLDALHRAWTVAREVASFAVFVEAKDESSSAFYKRFGFIPLPDDGLRLFLPMATLDRLFRS